MTHSRFSSRFCQLLFQATIVSLAALAAGPTTVSSQQPGAHSAPTTTNRWKAPASLLTAAAPTVSIGTEAQGPAAFGLIRRAVFDGLGNVYFADVASQQIRTFRVTGEFVGATGRAGRGPGDFGELSGIAHDGISTLYVADPANGLSIYRTSGGAPVFLSRVLGDKFPQAVCVSKGTPVVLANIQNRLLHRLDRSGKIVASFGQQLGGDSVSQVQEMMMWRSGALMHCDTSGAIYVAVESFGEVRKYSPDGVLLWQINLPDFKGHRLVFDPKDNSIAVQWGRYGTAGLFVLDDMLVVQAIDATRSGRRASGGGVRMEREVHGTMTYVLSAAAGSVLAKGYWSPLISDVRKGVAISIEEDPFPRAKVQRLSAR